MSTSEYIEFRKVRDFGDVINVTFTFLRQNIELLGKSLLFIVGPVALIAGISSIGYWTQMPLNMLGEEAINSDLSAGLFGISYLLFIGLSMLSTVLAITVVNGYMILYQEKGPGNFHFEDVWNVVKDRIGMMMGTSVFAFVLYFGSLIIFLIPTVVVLMGASTASIIVGAGLTFIAFIAWFAAFFYFIVVIALLFPIRMMESRGIMDTVNRSRYLIKNNYGNTFAVLMVSGILMTILNLLFSMPSYMLAFMGGFHAITDSDVSWFKYPVAAMSIVGVLGSSLLYSIPLVATTLQYFNLVEKKEKTGLMSRIDVLNEGDDDLF